MRPKPAPPPRDERDRRRLAPPRGSRRGSSRGRAGAGAGRGSWRGSGGSTAGARRSPVRLFFAAMPRVPRSIPLAGSHATGRALRGGYQPPGGIKDVRRQGNSEWESAMAMQRPSTTRQGSAALHQRAALASAAARALCCRRCGITGAGEIGHADIRIAGGDCRRCGRSVARVGGQVQASSSPRPGREERRWRTERRRLPAVPEHVQVTAVHLAGTDDHAAAPRPHVFLTGRAECGR